MSVIKSESKWLSQEFIETRKLLHRITEGMEQSHGQRRTTALTLRRAMMREGFRCIPSWDPLDDLYYAS